MTTKSTLLLLALGLLLAPAGAAGTGLATAALGNAGELYELTGGAYGDLFPAADELPADHSVLALTVRWPDETAEQWLVPGADDRAPESRPALLYDRFTAVLVVLWQSEELASGTLLRLVTRSEGSWSEVLTIEDPTLAAIDGSQIAMTRDRYVIELEEDRQETVERTILHAVWLASDGDAIDVRYSPLIFINGLYCGWHEVFSLRDLLSGETTDPVIELDGPWLAFLDLAVTRNGQRIHVAFVNSLSGELTVADVGVLPLELTYLSDEIRHLLLALEDSFTTDDLASFAGHARLEIIGTGMRQSLNPALVNYVAHEVSSEILTVGQNYSPAEFEALVNHLRDFTIGVTSPLISANFTYAASPGSGRLIELDIGDLLDEEGQYPPQILDLNVRSSRPVPALDGEPPTTIYTSRDGEDVLIVWEDEEQRCLYYVESLAAGWSEPRALPVDDELPRARAYEILEQRIR